MIEETYLLGMSRDASIGAFLGFGASTFAYLFVFWADSAARHLKDTWARRGRGKGKRWRAKR